jgi:hypothetical protein
LDTDQPLDGPIHVAETLGHHHGAGAVVERQGDDAPGRIAGDGIGVERLAVERADLVEVELRQVRQRICLGQGCPERRVVRGALGVVELHDDEAREWAVAAGTRPRWAVGGAVLLEGGGGLRQLGVDPVDQVAAHDRGGEHTGGNQGQRHQRQQEDDDRDAQRIPVGEAPVGQLHQLGPRGVRST